MSWRITYIPRESFTRGMILPNIVRLRSEIINSALHPNLRYAREIIYRAPDTTSSVDASVRNLHCPEETLAMVYYWGESIDFFRGHKLMELPTPLVCTVGFKVRFHVVEEQHPHYNALIIAYGRRLFMAVRPLVEDEEMVTTTRLVLQPGRERIIPLPPPFPTPVRPDIVEDFRVGDSLVDPLLTMGLVDGNLTSPVVDACERFWNGFLVFERQKSEPLTVRSTAVRLSFADHPLVEDLHRLPQRLELREADKVSMGLCMDRVSAPHAEWLGVFITKDEMGVAATSEDLDKIHQEMSEQRKTYQIRVCTGREGWLFLWTMCVGRDAGIQTFVFAFLPDVSMPDLTRLSLTRTDGVVWRGLLRIDGQDALVRAVRMETPGMSPMTNFRFCGLLNCVTYLDVRTSLPWLRRVGTWAVRITADEEGPGENVVLNAARTMMEGGKTGRVFMGSMTAPAFLFLFADNVYGVGISLIGVRIDFGEGYSAQWNRSMLRGLRRYGQTVI